MSFDLTLLALPKLSGREIVISHVKENQTSQRDILITLFRNRSGFDPDQLTYRGCLIVPTRSVPYRKPLPPMVASLLMLYAKQLYDRLSKLFEA